MNAIASAQRHMDPRRQMAVDVALSLAELNAGWGDYDRALEHLAAAEQLTTGTFGGHLQEQRESWLEQAAADRGSGLPSPAQAVARSPL